MKIIGDAATNRQAFAFDFIVFFFFYVLICATVGLTRNGGTS